MARTERLGYTAVMNVEAAPTEKEHKVTSMLNLTCPDGGTYMVECSGDSMSEALGQGIEKATGWRLNWHMRTNPEPAHETPTVKVSAPPFGERLKAAWRILLGRRL